MESFEPLQLQFTYNAEDMPGLVAWRSRPKARFRVGRALAAVAGGAIAGGVFYGIALLSQKPATTVVPPPNTGLGSVVVAVLLNALPCLMFLAVIIALLLWVWHFNRKQWSSRQHGSQEVTLNNEAIVWKTPSSQRVFEWKHFDEFVETGKAFLLRAPTDLLVFPKRVMTEEQRRTIRNMLTTRVGPVSPSVEI